MVKVSGIYRYCNIFLWVFYCLVRDSGLGIDDGGSIRVETWVSRSLVGVWCGRGRGIMRFVGFVG